MQTSRPCDRPTREPTRERLDAPDPSTFEGVRRSRSRTRRIVPTCEVRKFFVRSGAESGSSETSRRRRGGGRAETSEDPGSDDGDVHGRASFERWVGSSTKFGRRCGESSEDEGIQEKDSSGSTSGEACVVTSFLSYCSYFTLLSCTDSDDRRYFFFENHFSDRYRGEERESVSVTRRGEKEKS